MTKIFRILLISIIVASCSLNKKVTYRDLYNSYAKYSTSKEITLDTILNSNVSNIEFENKNSKVVLRTETVLNYAIKVETNDSLCAQKKRDLESLINMIHNHNNGFYKIEQEIIPTVYKRLGYEKPKRYEDSFVKPYGYAIETDTINKTRLDILKDWMISDLCINGKCIVLDKRTKTFADTIYYEIIDFKDEHGGESLVFKDRKPFFNVKVYSDIAWPDFDCMSADEIEKWKKK